MTDDEDLVLILAPARDGDVGVPGLVIVTADCGHQALISPSGLAATLARPSRTVCMPCVPPGVKEMHGPVPGAREELIATVGAEMADRLIATVMKHAAEGGTF